MMIPDDRLHPMIRPLWQSSMALWWESDEWPDLGRTYSRQEQTERLAHLDRFMNFLELELRHVPISEEEQHLKSEKIYSRFSEFAQGGLDWKKGLFRH